MTVRAGLVVAGDRGLGGAGNEDALLRPGLTRPPAGTTRYDVTSVPGGRAGRASTLGGNGLAVSRASTHAREAIELVRFLRQRDVERARASSQSPPPARLELLELPPFVRLAESKHPAGHVVTRPSVVAGQHYEEVTRAYIRQVRSELTGEKLPSVG